MYQTSKCFFGPWIWCLFMVIPITPAQAVRHSYFHPDCQCSKKRPCVMCTVLFAGLVTARPRWSSMAFTRVKTRTRPRPCAKVEDSLLSLEHCNLEVSGTVAAKRNQSKGFIWKIRFYINLGKEYIQSDGIRSVVSIFRVGGVKGTMIISVSPCSGQAWRGPRAGCQHSTSNIRVEDLDWHTSAPPDPVT